MFEEAENGIMFPPTAKNIEYYIKEVNENEPKATDSK